MEWNGIEWGGTYNLPHFFLLILRASECFFFFFFFFFFFLRGVGGGGGARVSFRGRGSILRSSGLSDETSNRMSPIFWSDVKPEMIMFISITFRSIPFQVLKKCQFWNPLCVHILTDMSSFYLSLTGH